MKNKILWDILCCKYSNRMVLETLILPISYPYRKLFDAVIYGMGLPKVDWTTLDTLDITDRTL